MENETIKDFLKGRTFIENNEDRETITFGELKAKVIEWIKEDEGLRKDNTIWRMNQDELLDYLNERWMKRFDIS